MKDAGTHARPTALNSEREPADLFSSLYRWLFHPKRKRFLLPATGVWILALDWLLFSSNALTTFAATPAVMAVGFVLGSAGASDPEKGSHGWAVECYPEGIAGRDRCRPSLASWRDSHWRMGTNLRRYKMRRIKTGLIFGVCLWLMSVPAISGAQEIEPSIEPQADNILRQMSAYVGGFQHFTIHVENSVDTLLPCSQKLQLSRTVDMFVKRPNRFRANIDGDVVDQELYYDGTSITLYSKDVNVYASLAVPPTIDAAMDYAIESFGLVAPMVDLIYKDAYEILIEDVQSGSYVGLSKVFGVECHHLAFRGAETGWQIWIENSKTPLPRKIVITSRWVAGAPQFTAFLNDWDASIPIKEGLFTFKAPETAERIEFLPAAK